MNTFKDNTASLPNGGVAVLRPRHVDQQAIAFADRIALQRIGEIHELTKDSQGSPVEVLQAIRNIIERC